MGERGRYGEGGVAAASDPPIPTLQERWDATLPGVPVVQNQSFHQEIEI